jgi:hypothetical protein
MNGSTSVLRRDRREARLIASDTRAQQRNRSALLVFTAVEVGALILYAVVARGRWFLYDEWDFLSDRQIGSVDDLFRPHNVHWSTLPIIVYRALWGLFGLRTYFPYQILAIAAHLVVAALLRVVMVRAGVNAWIATAAASLFALFGAGSDNIVWAFQIGFVGSMGFGLVHLLLADHDGRISRRDGVGVLAGIAGLMCSSVGAIMVATVGLAVLIRRGWRVALAHTVPPAAVYLIWWAVWGREHISSVWRGDAGDRVRFVTTGIGATFDALGQLPGVGLALGALLVVGLVVAWGRVTTVEWRTRAALPAALLFGAFAFLVLTAARGVGRTVAGIGVAANFGPESARAGRYLHLVAAFTLPAIAVAATAVARRWKVLAPVVVVLLLVGIPGNIDALDDDPLGRARFHRAYRRQLLLVPRVPIADEVPGSVRPDPVLAPWVTLEWLRDGVAAGKLPDIGGVRSADAADASLALALRPQLRVGPLECTVLQLPARLQLAENEVIRVRDGRLRVTYVDPDGARSRGRVYRAPRVLRALAGPLDLQLRFESPGRLDRCARA